MSIFRNLFNHQDEYVRETAILLADIEEAFVLGEITETDFNELADDILELEGVLELTDSIERRSQITQAAKKFKSIVTTITRGS